MQAEKSEYVIQVSEDKKVRPDIKAMIENKPLFIEFAYSSYIDYEKNILLKKRLNVIEIELNAPYINWNDFKSEEELEKSFTLRTLLKTLMEKLESTLETSSHFQQMKRL